MTGPRDTHYPPPDPQRVERALSAMHPRRARLRRVRIIGASCALVVCAAVAGAVYAGASSSGEGRGVEVQGGSTTSTVATDTTETSTPPATAASTTLAPTSTTTASTSTSTTTSVLPVQGTGEITYQPFTAAGTIDPTFHVTATATGTCINGESSRSYRCFGGAGGIYDPCFAGSRGPSESLACPDDPTNRNVTMFAATSVSSDQPTSPLHAWAIELANGQICRFASAATTGLGPYHCQPNATSAPLADCLEPKPTPIWRTAECQETESLTSPLASYRVTNIWF